MPNHNKNKTHCPKGHPLKEGNLVLSALKQGKRSCLICRKEGDRRRRNPDGNVSPAILNSQKTHCPKGHPLKGENLIPSELKLGKRSCKICKNKRNRIKEQTPERKSYQKTWRTKNNEKSAGYSKKWRDENPEKAKQWDKNNPEKRKARGKKHDQTPKRKAYRKDWSKNKYATNDEWREKVLENNANWRAENPRSGAGYSLEEQIAMMIRRKINNNTCQWQIWNPKTKKSQICGIKASKTNSIHVNHIFSRAKYPELRDNPKFMICYCVNHHADWHLAKGEIATSKLIRSKNISKKQFKLSPFNL